MTELIICTIIAAILGLALGLYQLWSAQDDATPLLPADYWWWSLPM